MITYLTFEQIVRLNQRTVKAHGGNFVPPHNLLHGESLQYLPESVSAELFGQPMYPTIPDKAALYMHSVVSNHVFQDGNKRTGLGAAMVFLQLNGWRLIDQNDTDFAANDGDWSDISPDELYHFTISVASGEQDLEAVRAWFGLHAKEK